MQTKTYEFELDGGTLDVDLPWSYERTPAILDGPLESRCPEEESCEVFAPDNLDDILEVHAIKQKRIWRRQVLDKIMDLQFDNKPREWAEELANDF